MSILIKGMEMPKGNSTINVLIYSDGRVFTGNKNDDKYSAVEVPTPHKRLVEFIDVVTVEDEDSSTEEVNFGDVLKAYYEMREASTVIEAEE